MAVPHQPRFDQAGLSGRTVDNLRAIQEIYLLKETTFPKTSGTFRSTGEKCITRSEHTASEPTQPFQLLTAFRFNFSRRVFRSMPRISAALVLLPSTLSNTLRIYSDSIS